MLSGRYGYHKTSWSLRREQHWLGPNRLVHMLLSCAEMWVLIITGVDYKTFSNVTLLPFYIRLSKDQ